jgi:hypothetical protein
LFSLQLRQHQVSDSFAILFFMVVHEAVCSGIDFDYRFASICAPENVESKDQVGTSKHFATRCGPGFVPLQTKFQSFLFSCFFCHLSSTFMSENWRLPVLFFHVLSLDRLKHRK